MPKYTYFCDKCEITIEIRHMMSEICEDCKECNSKKTLRKIPSIPFIIKKTAQREGKVGDVTDDFIKDSKKELEKEKKVLRNREYKP